MQFVAGGYSNELKAKTGNGYSCRAYVMRCDVGQQGAAGCGNLVWVQVNSMKVCREGKWN